MSAKPVTRHLSFFYGFGGNFHALCEELFSESLLIAALHAVKLHSHQINQSFLPKTRLWSLIRIKIYIYILVNHTVTDQLIFQPLDIETTTKLSQVYFGNKSVLDPLGTGGQSHHFIYRPQMGPLASVATASFEDLITLHKRKLQQIFWLRISYVLFRTLVTVF